MRKMRRGPAATAWLAAAVAVALAAGGCGEMDLASSPSAVDDEAVLREFMETDDYSALGGPYDGEQIDVGSIPLTRDEINPLSFWREVEQKIWEHERIVNPEEGTAECTSRVQLFGTLNILDENMVEYAKPMHHSGVRYAEFERDDTWSPQNANGSGNGQADGDGAGTQARRGRWVLTAISGFRAQSDTLTMSIDWVRFQGSLVDATISDPLELLAVPDGIMAFGLGEEVTVTVAGPPEGSILFLHAPFRRVPLQYQSDGTFTAAWTVQHRGRHGVWIEAIAHDSIFDSEYPDDTLVWGTPYRVLAE